MADKEASPEKRIGEETVTSLKYTPPKEEKTVKSEALKLFPLAKAMVELAGARHSRGDNELLQQIHDMVCELGASCYEGDDELLEEDDLVELKAALDDVLVERHLRGKHNQRNHGMRHGVGGLREFAGARGYKVRQIKGKDGKIQYAISGAGGNMRAEGLTDARKLITSNQKFKRESEKKLEQSKKEARSKLFESSIATQVAINNLTRQRDVLQGSVDSGILKPKYRKERAAQVAEIDKELAKLAKQKEQINKTLQKEWSR